MLLNNYWNYLNAFGDNLPDITDYYAEIPALSFMDAPAMNFNVIVGMYNTSSYVPQMSSNYAIRYNLGIALGTGSTAVAPTNYNLNSEIASGTIPDLTYNISTGVDQDVLKLTAIISGTNASANQLTISELGIYKNVYTLQINGSDCWRLLFLRHILESPKVVQPGQGFSFAFEWIDS